MSITYIRTNNWTKIGTTANNFTDLAPYDTIKELYLEELPAYYMYITAQALPELKKLVVSKNGLKIKKNTNPFINVNGVDRNNYFNQMPKLEEIILKDVTEISLANIFQNNTLLNKIELPSLQKISHHFSNNKFDNIIQIKLDNVKEISVDLFFNKFKICIYNKLHFCIT